MTATRQILHADLDAFYAAVEQRDRPELRGKPVVVGGEGPRSVVATASYEARRFGIRSAMPSVQARRLCPQAVFVMPRMQHYAAIGAQVRDIFLRFTDLVEPLSLDEAFLDVTGSRALFGDGERIGRAIREAVRSETALTISVGVAAVKFVAKIASDLRKPDALVVVPPGAEVRFLAPLPVRFLWGAGKKAQEVLARHGLATIGDVQQLTEPALEALFGKALGAHFHALAHARDPREVVPDHDARSISHELTFWPDLTTKEQCEQVLLRLSEQVCTRLREDRLVAGLVRLKLRDPDFTTITRQRTLATPTCQDLEVYGAAKRLFAAARPSMRPVRLLGVVAAALVAQDAPRQRSLFAHVPSRGQRYLEAVDSIRKRFGYGAIRHGGPECLGDGEEPPRGGPAGDPP
jgi:DNA polymerase-4